MSLFIFISSLAIVCFDGEAADLTLQGRDLRPSQPVLWQKRLALKAKKSKQLLRFQPQPDDQQRENGVEFKFTEAPKVTRSMRTALSDLTLNHLWIIYPGTHHYPADKKLSVWPLQRVRDLAAELQS